MKINQDLNLISKEYNNFKEVNEFDYNLTKNSENRLETIISHLYQQHKEYISSTNNTSVIFEEMLNEANNIVNFIRKSIILRGLNPSQVFCEIDADRSVAILNILWHTISFTTRGNTKPMALYRKSEPPLFTGRIIAFNGDFQDIALDMQNQQYPDMLSSEIASLYVPHDNKMPAIVKINHIPDKELYWNQKEAPKLFLLKVIEIICGGGIYHESDLDIEEE